MKPYISKIIIFTIISSLTTGCKNDQLEKAIKGTYYNNNYKLEIKEEVGEHIRGGKSLFKTLTLSKWENEHENLLEIEGPGYYEISGGIWEIDDGSLKITLYNKEVDLKDWNYQIIPINFDPSASKDYLNMNASFILRGNEQKFFSKSISQGYHSE